jgi:hypothetical protein
LVILCSRATRSSVRRRYCSVPRAPLLHGANLLARHAQLCSPRCCSVPRTPLLPGVDLLARHAQLCSPALLFYHRRAAAARRRSPRLHGANHPP